MKEKLLLHVCCAPCFSGCFGVLKGERARERVLLIDRADEYDFDLTLFFENSNISPETEYRKRLSELRRLNESLDTLPLVESRYDFQGWNKKASRWADEPERSRRCLFCYEWRLRKSFAFARDKGFDRVATTLTLSPHKDAIAINRTGERLSREFKVAYLPTDFKKGGGYQLSIELSREYGLYRQDYCGCVYSKYQVNKNRKAG